MEAGIWDGAGKIYSERLQGFPFQGAGRWSPSEEGPKLSTEIGNSFPIGHPAEEGECRIPVVQKGTGQEALKVPVPEIVDIRKGKGSGRMDAHTTQKVGPLQHATKKTLC